MHSGPAEELSFSDLSDLSEAELDALDDESAARADPELPRVNAMRTTDRDKNRFIATSRTST
jgi:hypothetical protein